MNEQGIVLLVEDDKNILSSNRRILERSGITVLTAENLHEAREHLKNNALDVLVLDIMLPDGDGLTFLPELRKSCSAPVLFLTGKSSPDEKLAGLSAGGIDYITKPYDIHEFRQRVINFLALQRHNRTPEQSIFVGPVKLDLIAQQAFLKNKNMLLAPKEFALLHLFAAHKGENVSAEYLYDKVWNAPINEDDSALKNTIYKLRKKLAGSGFTISNERGEGYCLEQE